MRTLFMGTPEFAVPCLDKLMKMGCNVIGAVTQPDKPKGRGHKLTPPPVKEYALQNGIPVFQPEGLKGEAFKKQLEELNPDLIIVVAYGKILPKYILEYPVQGCINVHASILPKYRGAGPIQWSVINGEKTTGITTMYMDTGLDTGDMILKGGIEIGEDETAGELHDRLSVLGAEVLEDTVRMIETGNVPREQQDDSQYTYAPMLDKSIAAIDWRKTALEIKNLVRGLNPWPVAFTLYKGIPMKIYAVEVVDYESKMQPGTIIKPVPQKGLLVQAEEHKGILVKEVQFQGGKRMRMDEYLRGHEIEIGEVLGRT